MGQNADFVDSLPCRSYQRDELQLPDVSPRVKLTMMLSAVLDGFAAFPEVLPQNGFHMEQEMVGQNAAVLADGFAASS